MKKIKLGKKEIIIISLIVLVFIIAIIALLLYVRPKTAKVVPNSEEKATMELLSHEVYDEDTDINLATIDAYKSDYSAVLVKDQAIVTLRESTIKKYNGLISDSKKLEEIGLNSAIVVSYGSQLKTTNSKIETTVDYTNGIYVSGQKTKAYVIDSTISSYGTYNNGAVVATSGYLELEHSNIITKFKYSPALIVKTDRGEAKLNNVMLETNGNSSPLFKSSGTITLTGSTGTANGSKFAILNGGSLTVKGSTLIAAGASNDGTDSESGFSINGKESETTIKLEDSSLNINSKMPYYRTAILFDINSSKSTISLKNNQFNYGSNKLLKLTDSEVTVNCDHQTLQGELELNKNSKLNINLKNSSVMTGTINHNQNSNIIVSLDSSSQLVLTEDTYIKELKNEKDDNSNIIYNDHKLYVNGVAIN